MAVQKYYKRVIVTPYWNVNNIDSKIDNIYVEVIVTPYWNVNLN